MPTWYVRWPWGCANEIQSSLNPKLALGETIENLLDAASLSLEEEYRDQIRHLPL